MDSQKRLSLLQNMLNRLTGTEPETPKVAQVTTPPRPVDPNERKLQLLQSMLSKLQGS
jgi:hypothetical protein